MTRRTAAGDRFSAIAIAVLQLGALLERAGDAIAEPAGQSAARWKVMGLVDDEPRTVADIARIMKLARQSVQRVVDALLADGIVAEQDNPAHQRARLVALTPRGRKALDQIEEVQHAWANRVAARLGATVLERAPELLEHLLDAVERDPVTEQSR